MPKSPTLTNLKSRTVQAQRELDTILKVTENKRTVLDQVLLEIKTAQTILEDNFSHESLNQQREHSKLKVKLEAEINNLIESITTLKTEADTRAEITKSLESKESDLRLTIEERNTNFQSIISKHKALEVEVNNLNSNKTNLVNDIKGLEIVKKSLGSELSNQKGALTVKLSSLRSVYAEEQAKLSEQIKQSKIELRELQQNILLHSNKAEQIKHADKKRDNDLIARENSLTIKTKALAKERAEFETETRRWNYIKPIPKNLP